MRSVPPKSPDLKASRRPVYLFFHGNGELASSYAQSASMPMPSFGEIVRVLTASNQGDAILVEYSGYGASTGVPSLRALLEDARGVYDYVRKTALPGSSKEEEGVGR